MRGEPSRLVNYDEIDGFKNMSFAKTLDWAKAVLYLFQDGP